MPRKFKFKARKDVVDQEKADTLRALGFHSMEHFRRSPACKALRQQVFAKSGGKCYRCKTASASRMHFAAVTVDSLTGKRPEHVEARCVNCGNSRTAYQGPRADAPTVERTKNQKRRERRIRLRLKRKREKLAARFNVST